MGHCFAQPANAEQDETVYCASHSADSNACNKSGSTNLTELFGSGYDIFASANLSTTSFDVQLLGSLEQSANQVKIEWNWNIFPKSSGTQVVNIGITLHWKPISSNGGKDIIRQIWVTASTITVNPLPFIQPGQVTISGVASGILGTLLTGSSLTWWWDGRKKKQEEKEKMNTTTILNGK